MRRRRGHGPKDTKKQIPPKGKNSKPTSLTSTSRTTSSLSAPSSIPLTSISSTQTSTETTNATTLASISPASFEPDSSELSEPSDRFSESPDLSDPSDISDFDSLRFAQSTLAPSIFHLALYYITHLLSLLFPYYYPKVHSSTRADMTIGLGKLWNGDRRQEDQVDLVEKRASKKVKRRRRKADQMEIEYFPGMVNLSGVLCYMNSVLQSLASVASLISHLDRIGTLALEGDLPTPVTEALADVLNELNTPHPRPPKALRPHILLAALHPLPAIRRLLSTREQQDAHELFVVLAEAISDEAMKVATEVVRLRGMADLLSLQAYCVDKGDNKDMSKTMGGQSKEKRKKAKGLAQPWEGLVARRRVCRTCGCCGEVRMDTLGGMELPIPLSGDVTLDSCIAEYLAPELLSGVTCEMCSLRQTLIYYRSETVRFSLPPNKSHVNSNAPNSATSSGSFSVLENLHSPDASSEVSDRRKKKAKEAKKVENRLQSMLDSSTVLHFGEPALPPTSGSSSGVPIKWQKVNSDSIREGIVTRPPNTLRLHITRSGMTPYGQLIKKTARVAFPLILDLSRFVTRGVWEERSSVLSLLTNGVKGGDVGARILYRLESAILHYGYTSSSGHFICIRRKPCSYPDGYGHGPTRARKACPDGCTCEECVYFGQVREQSIPGRGWLRISDDEVEEVGTEALVEARGAVFMLFYERVGEFQSELSHDEREASQSSQILDEEPSNV